MPYQTTPSTQYHTTSSTPHQTTSSTSYQTISSTPYQTTIQPPVASSQYIPPPMQANNPSAAAGSPNQVAGPVFSNSREIIKNENTTFAPSSTPQKLLDEDCNSMARLFSTSNILVNRDDLRKAWASARKAVPSKTAFRLACSILPLLFTTEELANSCGQGMKRKSGEIRPSLDASKIALLKDYVTAWCKKNTNSVVLESNINDAVTEQVSYARKKLKKGKE